MLHIPQEIKQMLQRNLSPTAIDFLNEKFREYEEFCHELKELKQEVKKLKEMESKAPQKMGYDYQPKGPQMRYKPWEDDRYFDEDEEEFEDRRGRPRYEARRGTRSEVPQSKTTIVNRRGGGRTSSEHIEEPYPKRRRVIPIYEEERTSGKGDDGEAIE